MNDPLTNDPPWIVEAKRHLGQHEGTNEKPNPYVLKMFAEAGHPEVTNDHKEAWCGVFVGCCMTRSEVFVPDKIDQSWATEWATFGRKLQQPIYGCIGVKRRGKHVEGEHDKGHVTFILGETPTHYICLGGNQGDCVCIEAISKDGFFAFRWPFGYSINDLPPLSPAMPMIKDRTED